MGGWLVWALLVLMLATSAVRGCHTQITAVRARAKRTADVAAMFAQARTRWDVGTAALADALTELDSRPAAVGFGDREVETELWRQALNAPALVEKETR